MELRHLRYFAAVAETLNFTRAARELRVAQPALSRQIRQLEEEAGVALLERNSRAVRLTAAGTAFLAEARQILERSGQAFQVARAVREDGARRLNLGYVWGLFHTLVPHALERFRKTEPDAAVNLFELTATQQAAALAAGKLDAGFIGFADEADEAGLAKRKVSSCAFIAALPKGHPEAKRAKARLAELSRDFFITISSENYPGASRIVTEACQKAGFRPRILQAAERGHAILGLVAGNCGVALLPAPLQALPHAGVVFRPLAAPPVADLFVAWKPGSTSPLVEALLKLFDGEGR